MIRIGIFVFLLALVLFYVLDHRETKRDIADGRDTEGPPRKPVTLLDYIFHIGFRGIAVLGLLGVLLIISGIFAFTGLPAW